MAAKIEWELVIGDSFPANQPLVFVVTRGPNRDESIPIDLTGYTIETSFTEQLDGLDVATATTALLSQVSNPGRFTYQVPASETPDLRARTHHASVAIVAPSGTRTTLVRALVRVRRA